MSNIVEFILALTCIIPAIAGIIKFKRMPVEYKPLILLLSFAVITEVVADIPYMLYNNYTIMSIAHKCYAVAEFFLIMSFFEKVNITKQRTFIWIITITGVITYLLGYFVFSNEVRKLGNHLIDIVFTVIICFFSIKLFASEIFTTTINPFRNSKMIIAFGCILYYCFYLLVSAFVNINPDAKLFGSIFSIHQVVNALTYFIFTWAILWIPTSRKY